MSHRVIQWGTGNVGYHSLRHILRHPDLELVGLHAYSAAKQGVDFTLTRLLVEVRSVAGQRMSRTFGATLFGVVTLLRGR